MMFIKTVSKQLRAQSFTHIHRFYGRIPGRQTNVPTIRHFSVAPKLFEKQCPGNCEQRSCDTIKAIKEQRKIPDDSPFFSDDLYATSRLPLSQCKMIHPISYYDDEFYKAEQERVFRTTWSCVGYTQNLKSHGDTIMADIGGQPIIVTRTRKGELKGFYNVCRHRGAKIVQKDGKYPVLSCPYHRWGYSLEGKLVATPLFTEKEKVIAGLQKGYDTSHMENFDKKDYGLFPIRVETISNMVFACVNPDAPPLKKVMGDVEEILAPCKYEDLVIARSKVFPKVKSNWKILQENFMEYLHLPSIHPALSTVSCVKDHLRLQGPGMYTGFITKPISASGSAIDPGVIPNFPGLPEEYQDMAIFHQLFPNVFFDGLPHSLYSVISFPKSAGVTEERAYLFVHPSCYNEPDIEKKLDDIWAFYDNVNVEDLEACEDVQKGVQCGPYDGGRLAFKFEETIHRWQNILANFMTGTPKIPLGDDEHFLGASFEDSIPWDQPMTVRAAQIPTNAILESQRLLEEEEKRMEKEAKKKARAEARLDTQAHASPNSEEIEITTSRTNMERRNKSKKNIPRLKSVFDMEYFEKDLAFFESYNNQSA